MAAVALSGIDHDLSFGQSFKKALLSVREGSEERTEEKKREADEKSIGFYYVFGWCHWPVNDPVTAAAV